MTDFAFFERLPETLDTERLLLRAPASEDAADIARLANNRKIHDNLARLPHPYTLADAEQFVARAAKSHADGTNPEHVWAIHTRDENFIGMISLNFHAGEPAVLGYWLGEPYWGEGFASEAVAAIVDASDMAGLPMLAARVITTNKASIAVLAKAGFVTMGEAIDDCGPHKGIAITSLQRERRL